MSSLQLSIELRRVSGELIAVQYSCMEESSELIAAQYSGMEEVQ